MFDGKPIEITGGDSVKLVKIIGGYPDFISALDGKTVGGSSAGAYLFSRHYYNNASGKVLSGLDLLPIRIGVHMDNLEFGSLEQKRSALEKIKDGTELILLDEAEWMERTVDVANLITSRHDDERKDLL